VTDQAFDRTEQLPHPHRVDPDAGTHWSTASRDADPASGYLDARPPAVPSRAPRKRPRRRLPAEVLTDAEVRALIAACDADTAIGLRHRALLAVLYRAGLRISEALQLRPKDVDPATGTIRVLFGKRGYARTVGVDPGAMSILQEWMGTRARLGYPPSAPVFCTANGKQITPAYIRRLLPRLGRQAGVFKRVHAHGFRHTHAAQLRSEGVDIGIISKQLGHISITTTARYLDHIAPFAVVEAMRKRAWTAATIAH
jgi:integrase